MLGWIGWSTGRSWIDVRLGIWASGHLGFWTSGYLGIWASGHLGIWASGNLGIWASGLLGLHQSRTTLHKMDKIIQHLGIECASKGSKSGDDSSVT